MFRIASLLCLALFVSGLASQFSTAGEKEAFKRIDTKTDEQLRKELELVYEFGFDQTNASNLYAAIQKMNRAPKSEGVRADAGAWWYHKLAAEAKQPQQAALPWRAGQDCQMGFEAAQILDVLSKRLRVCLSDSVPAGDLRPDPTRLSETLSGKRLPKVPAGLPAALGGQFDPKNWKSADALPTILQLLPVENTSVRDLLVRMLVDIDGKEASAALARVAMFDLSPVIREKAVRALASRPEADYKQTLLDAFRWPWPPVSQHAAEAMAALRMKSVTPDLIALLDQPDPRAPFVPEGSKDKGKHAREVVRINHMSNCMLCHAPSMSEKDLVRGRVPIPNEDPPPLYYHSVQSGLFVRADVTFIRQDFSVMQPVLNAKKWPGNQRYDYVLRTRKLTDKEAQALRQSLTANKKEAEFPQREAALFALREITGVDRGASAEDWRPLQKAVEKSPRPDSK